MAKEPIKGRLRYGAHELAYEIHGDSGVPCLLMHGLLLDSLLNRDLARRFVAFLLSRRFQEDIPLQMWVYPADTGARLPDVFRRFAAMPTAPSALDPALIDARRDDWTREWTNIVLK